MDPSDNSNDNDVPLAMYSDWARRLKVAYELPRHTLQNAPMRYPWPDSAVKNMPATRPRPWEGFNYRINDALDLGHHWMTGNLKEVKLHYVSLQECAEPRNEERDRLVPASGLPPMTRDHVQLVLNDPLCADNAEGEGIRWGQMVMIEQARRIRESVSQ